MSNYKKYHILRLILGCIFLILSMIYIIKLYVDQPTGEIVILLGIAPIFKYVFPSIFLFSIAMYSLYTVIDATLLLIDNNRLKNRSIKDHDERIITIREKSGTRFFKVVIVVEVLMTILLGSSNPFLFAGLLSNVILILFIYLLFMWYHSSKI
jgi:uncharacterized membrane protein